MSDMRRFIDAVALEDGPAQGDIVFLEYGDSHVVETVIMEVNGDELVLLADDQTLRFVEMVNEAESGKLVGEARYEIHHVDSDGKTKAIQHYGDDYSDDTVRKDARYLQRQNPHATIKVYKDREPFDFGDVNEDGHDAIEGSLSEAEYRGHKVPLGKPMRGDVKKFKVYVRKPNGKVVKVNFGDKTMRIRKSNPKRRKSFRARHRCSNPGPRWKARYWSCRKW